jgi:hypothetical protein
LTIKNENRYIGFRAKKDLVLFFEEGEDDEQELFIGVGCFPIPGDLLRAAILLRGA